MRHIGLRRPRLSYANVAATLALVVALSGGALAATQYVVTSTNQIKPSVLKTLVVVPSAYVGQDNGNGGVSIASTRQILTTASGSGPLVVAVRSRIVATAALTLLGSNGPNLHVDCSLEIFQFPPVAGIIGTSPIGTVTLVNTSEYRDMPLTYAKVVGPGRYNPEVDCADRQGGTGDGAFVRGALSAVAVPLSG